MFGVSEDGNQDDDGAPDPINVEVDPIDVGLSLAIAQALLNFLVPFSIGDFQETVLDERLAARRACCRELPLIRSRVDGHDVRQKSVGDAKLNLGKTIHSYD